MSSASAAPAPAIVAVVRLRVVTLIRNEGVDMTIERLTAADSSEGNAQIERAIKAFGKVTHKLDRVERVYVSPDALHLVRAPAAAQLVGAVPSETAPTSAAP